LRTWYGHIVKHSGRRLQLVHAAEKWALPGVRTVIESWGLIWGVDVTEPEELVFRKEQADTQTGEISVVEVPKGDQPTLDETLRRADRAALQERAEVWRREFERQDRAERLARAQDRDESAWEDAFRTVDQAAADRRRAKAAETAQDRQDAYRAALRRAKAQRPAEELQAAMERYRAA
jgi:hypothetical protein